MEGGQSIIGAAKYKTSRTDKPFKRKSCAKPFYKKLNKSVDK